MKYTAFLICEPGMDRPCFSHQEPSPEQRARNARVGGYIFELDLDIPNFEMVDGVLKPTLSRI